MEITVKDLIKELKKVDENRIVILASDAEGNNFSPLCNIWTGSYKAKTSYSGEAWLEKLTEEDLDRGWTEEDVYENGQAAIFLCPTN